MSYSDTIKELLDILDLNLVFEENCFMKERIREEICFVFKGTLIYTPEQCYHCHQENEQTIIKYSWKTVSILLNDVSNYKTILRMKKTTFFM